MSIEGEEVWRAIGDIARAQTFEAAFGDQRPSRRRDLATPAGQWFGAGNAHQSIN